jgi:predicted phosphodiesterase
MSRPQAWRVGIIGDVHGEWRNLARALARLRGDERVDCIVSVGDIVDGSGSVDRCCELLVQHDVLAVRGNHERWMFARQMRSLPNATMLRSLHRRSREFLASLPPVRVVPLLGGTLMVAHGVGDDDMSVLPMGQGGRFVDVMRRCRVFRSSCVAVISGHSHRQGSARAAGTLLVGAGTLMASRDPCFGVLDCVSNVVRFHRV